MPLEISSVSDDDIRKFVPDLFEAMGGDNNFVNATYPENLTEEGQKTAAERFIEHGKMDPTVRWCKVVDTDLGEIIGVSQWSVVQLHKPPEVDMDGPPGTWASDKDKEYARALNRSFMAYRREVFRKNELPIMTVNIMAVSPKHQYRGAGTMMTAWGTRLADELNALCVVEATTAARWMYEKAGFKVHSHSALKVPEEFKDRPVARLFFMLRPRSRKDFYGPIPFVPGEHG